MNNERIIERFMKYCDNHMWMSELHVRILENYLASGNVVQEEELEETIEKHVNDTYKRWFLRTMGKKEVVTHYYRFNELFFPVGKECNVEIIGKYNYLRLAGSFKVVVMPYYDYERHCFEHYTPYISFVEAKDQKVSFSYTFDHEDCYNIYLFYVEDENEHLLFANKVYALDDDLYGLNYYKADFHMHTHFSDGIESPALVAASSRENGMDIIAVTDHNVYEGSVVAREKVEKMGLDMTVISGVEFSLAYSPMHILALGMEEDINRKYLSYELIKTDRAKQLLNETNDINCDKTLFVCTQLLLEEVRRLGGISVLAHPYWKPIYENGSRLDTPESVFVELSKHKRFDGIELVSGSKLGECNVSNLQTAFAQQVLTDNLDIPIIGITDSHAYSIDPICGTHYTVVFSKSRESKDVLEALRNGNCVAVEMINGVPICYGKHRYMKFVNFLISCYFPDRDKKAMAEAVLAKEKFICT